ncbi:hypothetical protein BC829DRAFT_406333 [Chytridium lagenaria]|nr:hypothetical protein BC829DRAFT_406333 [Chytridium lagenaria]
MTCLKIMLHSWPLAAPASSTFWTAALAAFMVRSTVLKAPPTLEIPRLTALTAPWYATRVRPAFLKVLVMGLARRESGLLATDMALLRRESEGSFVRGEPDVIVATRAHERM